MAHSQRLNALIKRLPKKNGHEKPLTVPYSVLIRKKASDYNIDGYTVSRMHFYDLQCLIIQFEIQAINEYFDTQRKRKLHERGISECSRVGGNDARKLFGG
jgi:hypothetical protein